MSEPPSLPGHIDRLLVGRVPARLALTVLAFAEEPGLPTALWRSGITALAGPESVGVTDEQLREFARLPVMAGVLLSSDDAYRMSPAAIDEVRPVAAAAIQHRLTLAWIADGRNLGWRHAAAYLL